ncbi:SAM-dependent methyltransferase [Flavobacteriaceae bacterium]|nr:SAM-dependent methyltransferase [Flavobacteriaceae bacterium]
MKNFEAISQRLRVLIESGKFVKMTLSKPPSKSVQLQNIYLREVEIGGEILLQWTYRYKTQDQTKNYSLDESVLILDELYYDDFRAVTLFSLEADYQFLISKKGKLTERKVTATFKNKPELSNDRVKVKRVSLESPYLMALGVTDNKGNLIPKMADKYRQINKYLEIIEGLLLNSDFPEEVHVVDMGSGKGYLTFALFDYMKNTLEMNVSMTGVELREELVDYCNNVASEIGFEGLNFVAERIENFKDQKIDILIALHACDTATDDALFAALQAQSELIIAAPCCHKQVRQQTKGKNIENPMLRHGIFKERAFEMLTDTIRGLILERSGYRTKIFEFVSNEHTRKNIMMVASKSNKKIDTNEIDQKIDALKSTYGVDYQYLEKKLALV